LIVRDTKMSSAFPRAAIREAMCGSEQIIIEPAVTSLDRDWTNAWEQRAKLLIVRATTGEPMPRG
jgi:hypothetical protein